MHKRPKRQEAWERWWNYKTLKQMGKGRHQNRIGKMDVKKK